MKMKPIKVLIIDDEQDFAETIVECLEIRGIEAKFSPGANDAMAEITSAWKPDVVILDLKMPEVNGLEALKLIKQYHPEIAVIMVTGHGSTTDGIKGMQQGLYDYLMKPVEINDLESMIKQAVGEKE